jgi:hypothetical protein
MYLLPMLATQEASSHSEEDESFLSPSTTSRHGPLLPLFLCLSSRVYREDEEVRIKELGGRVIFWGRWRVEGVLAVSRAIGDVNLKPYVTCDPEITTHALTPDDQYLILASDGLWDVMSNEEVGTFITR